ncbi:MAG: hypothetical protein PUJ85_04015 [bacterium]|nr:hypothetical protein [bacterium]
MIRELQRNRSQSNYNIKRERGWDNRFIYNKIPDYCAFQDKNFLNVKLFNEQAKRTNMNETFNRTSKSFYKATNRSNNITMNYHLQENMEPCDKIMLLWNDLGVLDNYRELFTVVANQLDDQARRDFYNLEIQNLTNIFDDLNYLVQCIQSREISISNLKKLNEKLSSILKETSPKSNEQQFSIIINEIQNVRMSTINVVNQMNKIRNKYSFCIYGGKFNIDTLGKKFSFDKNYLIKMKEEMTFLKYGYIKYFFNINESVDPFMLSASFDTGDPLQQQVPITQDMHEQIKLAQYLILQDLIFYQSASFKSHLLRTISPIKRRVTGSGNKIINVTAGNSSGYRTANNFYRSSSLTAPFSKLNSGAPSEMRKRKEKNEIENDNFEDMMKKEKDSMKGKKEDKKLFEALENIENSIREHDKEEQVKKENKILNEEEINKSIAKNDKTKEIKEEIDNKEVVKEKESIDFDEIKKKYEGKTNEDDNDNKKEQNVPIEEKKENINQESPLNKKEEKEEEDINKKEIDNQVKVDNKEKGTTDIKEEIKEENKQNENINQLQNPKEEIKSIEVSSIQKPEEEEMKMNHPNNIIDDQVIKSEKPNQEENQPKNEIIENNISNNNK